MKISQSWLKEYIDFPHSPEELSDALTMLGIEVEAIHDEGKKFKGFYIGKVLSKEKHPNADKLSVCSVTLGEGEQTIICGAPNVEAGQTVVVATQGAIVPSAGFEIALRKIRGIESNGMICSKIELGIGEDDGGIWVLPDSAIVGTTLSDYLGINDVIYEIGITPNRADCLSHIGIAREIASLLNSKLKAQYSRIESNPNPLSSITITIEDTEKCPRYAARIVRNIHVQESPAWLKNRLLSLGLRPRNAVVDVTNLVLMECGQPLHAFDAGTVEGNHIIVRTANNDEQFTTLDSKIRTLDDQMLMICDAHKPIAIGGVMGGENSEITDKTTSVLIESAYFNPTSIRRTGKKLGISSDASYRFERGVDIDNVLGALDRAATLIAELTGGIIENGMTDIYPNPMLEKQVTLRFDHSRKIIGVNISNDEMASLLSRIDCSLVDKTSDAITVIPPSYRVDISEEIDFIEEIARMFDYDNISPDLSSKFPSEIDLPKEFKKPESRETIRTFFVQHGFNEILTYSFLDKLQAKVFTENPIEIANPLGEDFSVMRPAMMPAMLRTIERNIRHGQTMLQLFDIGKTFHRSNSSQFIKGIEEQEHLCFAVSGIAQSEHWSRKSKEIDFYDVKGIAEDFLFVLNITTASLKEHTPIGIFNSNALDLWVNGKSIGTIGEISVEYRSSFGIEVPVFAAEINLTELYRTKPIVKKYKPVPQFPSIKRDVAFVVDSSIDVSSIQKSLKKAGGTLLQSLRVFDVFEGKSLGEGKKSIAFSLTFQSSERTLIEQEVNESVSTMITEVERTDGGKLRV